MSDSQPQPAAAERDTATGEQQIYGSPFYISMLIAENGQTDLALMDPSILQSGAVLVCIP